MILGLGGGSTAYQALVCLAERLHDGSLRDIAGVPCSRQVEADARLLGIPLTTLEDHPVIDLTLDGADEVSPELTLIKGGGGAQLREKIVAQNSRRTIILVDECKLVPHLGACAALPVAVVPFGWSAQQRFLKALGATCTLRLADGEPFHTDDGDYILDCRFKRPIRRPGAGREAAGTRRRHRAWVVPHAAGTGSGCRGERRARTAAAEVSLREWPPTGIRDDPVNPAHDLLRLDQCVDSLPEPPGVFRG